MIEKLIVIDNCQYEYQLECEEKPSQWNFADQDDKSWKKYYKLHWSKKHKYQDQEVKVTTQTFS